MYWRGRKRKRRSKERKDEAVTKMTEEIGVAVIRMRHFQYGRSRLNNTIML